MIKYMSVLMVVVLAWVMPITDGQSTCPVVQSPIYGSKLSSSSSMEQKCKCGIKVDGHIYIYCARKQLRQLPKFTRSSILYDELILSGNLIESVRVNSFNGLKVKRLFLDDNPLRVVERNSFVELANYLEELILSTSSGLARTRIESSLFQSLLNLKVIKLSGVYVASGESTGDGLLRQNLFNKTRKLEIINLVDCNLNRVESNSLNGVETSLKELNLDNNQLESTNELFNELKRMKRLQMLNLSRNRIKHLLRFMSTEQFQSAKSTENTFEIDLSFNGIVSIDERAFGSHVLMDGIASSISKLNLNNNELNQFQLGFVSQLEKLRELHLDYNKIEYINDNLFVNSRNLEVLSIKGNLIQKLNSEYAFSGLHFNLRRLNLAANRIEFINRRVFSKVNRLRELNLEKNLLDVHFDSIVANHTMDDYKFDLASLTFDGVESELRHINLEHNNLRARHLWSLVSLINLETIKVGNNDFSQLNCKSSKVSQTSSPNKLGLNRLFQYYRNLTTLDLQNSSLRQVPYFHGLNTTLFTLNLAANQLCNVNAKNLNYHYAKLKQLNLNSNPLKCDCNMIGLRMWLDETADYSNVNASGDSTQPSGVADNWKCLHSAHANHNKFFGKLTTGQFTCDDVADNTCKLDESFDEITTTTITTTTTTTSTSTTTTDTSTVLIGDEDPTTRLATKMEQIHIIEPASSSSIRFASNVKSPSSRTTETSLPPLFLPAPASSSSFVFSSVELRQTLLGSLIGALAVILIVFVLVCVVKSTRNRLLGKLDNDKDKSTTTTSTNGTTSLPYELGKLSLQTLCINSTGCSSSSSSSSSSSNETSTSCVCGMLNSAINSPDLNVLPDAVPNKQPFLFTKMDPLRLTLISTATGDNLISNRNSFHQNYLNHHAVPCNHHAQFLKTNTSTLHYLSSNLPYSPNQSSSPTYSTSTQSPTYAAYNEQADSNSDKKQQNGKIFNYFNGKNLSQSPAVILNGDTNTYDKLHQQRVVNSSSNLLRQTPGNNFVSCTSTLAKINAADIICNNCNMAETTPFLIIRNADVVNNLMADENYFNTATTSNRIKLGTQAFSNLIPITAELSLFQNLNPTVDQQPPQQQDSQEQSQHTYHEIGEVLLNGVNFNKSNKLNGNESKPKSNEMYI